MIIEDINVVPLYSILHGDDLEVSHKKTENEVVITLTCTDSEVKTILDRLLSEEYCGAGEMF